jgi:rare lipoprotein A (peptidoglycan hydrolase)
MRDKRKNPYLFELYQKPRPEIGFKFILAVIMVTLFAALAFGEEPLQASWYSLNSLKKEGTYKYSKGVMANGQIFNDGALTCATIMHPLGTRLLVRNLANGKEVAVVVTDRISKRFGAKRIDLSKRAFSEIADLKQGIVSIKVEVLK